MVGKYQSWGRNPIVEQVAHVPLWKPDNLDVFSGASIIPYGNGRSYGDCALNDGGTVVVTQKMDHFIKFDSDSGIIRCEAGVLLGDILKLAVPHGWFLPVTPGTKFISVGGAIANDVHGKNHHKAGCFGNHVIELTLLRSDGIFKCSEENNSDMFHATIGGIGLTGLILEAEIQLHKIQSSYINVESIQFSGVDEYRSLSNESDKLFDYTVAWIDCVTRGKGFARGVFMRGNHCEDSSLGKKVHREPFLNVPFILPEFLVNRYSMKLINVGYFYKQISKVKKNIQHYEPFFYPLDMISNWNRGYGRRGLLQFQCVVPSMNAEQVVKEMLKIIVENGSASFLSVLKDFGDITSKGMLSFPRKGMTLCMDFPNRGERSKQLFKKLENMTVDAGGALYTAKDSCMSSENFKKFYPNWEKFIKFIDPRFSSSLWRRVMGNFA